MKETALFCSYMTSGLLNYYSMLGHVVLLRVAHLINAKYLK